MVRRLNINVPAKNLADLRYRKKIVKNKKVYDRKKEKSKVYEVLDPSKGPSSYIKDFVKSKHPTFRNDSKEQRIKRAWGAYHAAKRKREKYRISEAVRKIGAGFEKRDWGGGKPTWRPIGPIFKKYPKGANGPSRFAIRILKNKLAKKAWAEEFLNEKKTKYFDKPMRETGAEKPTPPNRIKPINPRRNYAHAFSAGRKRKLVRGANGHYRWRKVPDSAIVFYGYQSKKE